MSNLRAILIAGPTASGKSEAALGLAEALGGTIINADSKQVYRDLRVLSARPSAEDEMRAPHALYGFVPSQEGYSVGRWLEDVETALAQVETEGKMPIVTGGTGLYFKALLEGLSPVPDIPQEVRILWRDAASEKRPEELHALLCERDPEMAEQLRPSDPQRIVRALEVLDATGRSLAQWQKQAGRPLLKADEALCIFVTRPRDELYARINARFDAMVSEGALDEVQALAAQQLDPDLPVMRAHGVKPLMELLSGTLTRDEAIERVKTDTRRYAKRQETWAKRNMIAWKRIEKKESKSLMSNIFSFIDV
ncbi:MAG: tRNA (adenosine(37)-N6)-dimethylallyltransferase MiaA [Hyphomicrobiaceae bacterium]|nr:tRNA (adenosine(37)-N6)-dimethylallyltransferase MiaA [Hyphomicrobiaceae bacterium]